MKTKRFISAFMVLALSATLTLAGCGDSDSGDNTGGGDELPNTLRVTNCTQKHISVVRIYPNVTITTKAEFNSKYVSDDHVALLYSSASYPFKLKDRTGDWWRANGQYLVIVYFGSDDDRTAFKSGVTFTNGSATIDHNSMTKVNTLPDS